MPTLFGIFVLMAVFGHSIGQQPTAESSYIAAVAEIPYDPSDRSNISASEEAALLLQRTAEYVRLIGEAADQQADIIVFPEMTLTLVAQAQLVPDTQLNRTIVPCSDPNYAETPVAAISCAARTRRIYVVINLTMRRPCGVAGNGRPCANVDGQLCSLYNTNVVFDRNGAVISTYRKHNLFGEKLIQTPVQPDLSVFDTDFGVRFGHFICFDILFDVPTLELVRLGVRNFIYPSMWFAELPFLSGVQSQQSWAFAYDVNLLAAGANNASVGSGGSGIYAGRAGPLATHMSADARPTLLVRRIGKVPPAEQTPGVPTDDRQPAAAIAAKRDPTPYTFVPVLLANTTVGDRARSVSLSGNHTINGGQMSCAYRIAARVAGRLAGLQSYSYFLAMYNGRKSYDGIADSVVNVCAIIACPQPDAGESCGQRYAAGEPVQHERYEWLSLEVRATFGWSERNLTMPSTLTGSFLPLNSADFAYAESKTDSRSTVQMNLLSGEHRSNELLTFGVYCVDFSTAVALRWSLVSCLLLAVVVVLLAEVRR